MANRLSWHEYFMEHAKLAAKRSTCIRIQTGSVLVRDNRIISEGYNGTVSGAEHCCDYAQKQYWWEGFIDSEYKFEDYIKSEEFYKSHHEWSNVNEIHGEQNAILYACRKGIKTNNADLYTVYGPCIICAKVIVTAGIKKVYFCEYYDRDTQKQGLKFLLKNQVQVFYIPADKSEMKELLLANTNDRWQLNLNKLEIVESK